MCHTEKIAKGGVVRAGIMISRAGEDAVLSIQLRQFSGSLFDAPALGGAFFVYEVTRDDDEIRVQTVCDSDDPANCPGTDHGTDVQIGELYDAAGTAGHFLRFNRVVHDGKKLRTDQAIHTDGQSDNECQYRKRIVRNRNTENKMQQKIDDIQD